jgi:hypothetical protein
MSKMGLHDPFEVLKHKLWPKEGPGIKVAIWLPTIKSQESPNFLMWRWRVIYRWKTLHKGYNFASCLTPNRRSAHKVMGLHSYMSPNFGNFGTLTWESQNSHLRVPGQNDIWVLASWLGIKNTIRGKVVASPNPGRGESYEFVFARGSSVHQNALTMH